MNSVGINTTQNVSLQYPLAGVGTRIGAFLIDYLIIMAVLIFSILILGSLRITSMWFFILIALFTFSYFLISEILMNGQTIGKRAVHIKVVKLDGSKPSIGAYILRWILLPIDTQLFSGAIAIVSIVITENGQRLGDILAGTTVVKLKADSVQNLQKRRSLVQLEEGYTPIYPQAAFISDEEIRLMDKALKAFNRSGARGPMESMQEKISKKYMIESRDLPIRFLHTLQKDHAYFEREKMVSGE